MELSRWLSSVATSTRLRSSARSMRCFEQFHVRSFSVWANTDFGADARLTHEQRLVAALGGVGAQLRPGHEFRSFHPMTTSPRISLIIPVYNTHQNCKKRRQSVDNTRKGTVNTRFGDAKQESGDKIANRGRQNRHFDFFRRHHFELLKSNRRQHQTRAKNPHRRHLKRRQSRQTFHHQDKRTAPNRRNREEQTPVN